MKAPNTISVVNFFHCRQLIYNKLDGTVNRCYGWHDLLLIALCHLRAEIGIIDSTVHSEYYKKKYFVNDK